MKVSNKIRTCLDQNYEAVFQFQTLIFRDMIALQDWQATKEKIICPSGWSAIVSIAFKNALDSSKRKGR